MPIFDYECQACGHHFDVLQKAGDGVLRKCPECGKLKLRKCLSAPSFHLKGSGWYQTDFRDKGKSGSALADPDAKSAAGGDGDSKPVKKGHTLDSGPAHSHDDHGHSPGGAHKHSHDDKPPGDQKTGDKTKSDTPKAGGGTTHSHGGKTHSHGPGHKHDH